MKSVEDIMGRVFFLSFFVSGLFAQCFFIYFFLQLKRAVCFRYFLSSL